MKYCLSPFQHMNIAPLENGAMKCYACCPHMLPVAVGDLTKNTIEEIWNGPIYTEIRQSILDGTYKYCKADICPEIQRDALFKEEEIQDFEVLRAIKRGISHFNGKPKQLNLNYSLNCNFSCPSCRREPVYKEDEDAEKLAAQVTDQILKQDLSNTELIVCSSGDPFANRHFKRLLRTLDGKAHLNLKIQIMTNGQLLDEKMWKSIANIHANISMICISLDAATNKTYSITRRGGNWENLINNLTFLSSLRRQKEFPFLRLDFVVQDHNYLEMSEFVKLGEQFSADQVYFQKVVNFGAFSEAELAERAIHERTHPKHTDFIATLKNPSFRKTIVNMGNLSGLLPPKDELSPRAEQNFARKFILKNAVRDTLLNSLKKTNRTLKIYFPTNFFDFLRFLTNKNAGREITAAKTQVSSPKTANRPKLTKP